MIRGRRRLGWRGFFRELGSRDGVGSSKSCILNVGTENAETDLIVLGIKICFGKFLVGGFGCRIV